MKADYYDNRELSWLKFNERVLEEAADESIPFCERLSFISIFQSNLDEFFRVRVGALHDQSLVAGDIRENKTNMTSKEQIEAILSRVRDLSARKDRIYQQLISRLGEEGVELLNFTKLEENDKRFLRAYFMQEVRPLLSPQIIGKRQSFPFLKNQEIYAVVVLETKGGNQKTGIVPCSNGVFERLVPVPSRNNCFMLIEELILHFVPQIFDRYKVKSKSLIRIIRNADIDANEDLFDEDLDFRDLMEHLVKERKKLCPVKLEYSRVLDEDVVTKLCARLDLKKEQLFYSQTPLELSFVFRLQDVLREKRELFYPKRVPQRPACIDPERKMIPQIQEGDKLLSYPFESMNPFLRLLNEAARDPKVVSMKMTLYRVARMSKVVEALMEAAENGKEVVVLVELRARFDEENNIGWSRRLEEAGCRIIYGLEKWKVHSKLCLITRKGDNGVEYITQIGTGNYNEKTAALYTDLSYMTASVDIGVEANKVFDTLAMGQVMEQTEHLLVAPRCLQGKILDMMDEEIKKAENGQDGYIGAKLNSLTDKVIIDKIVEASRAGVRVELVVRGISCLIAGAQGATENVTIRSIVGRFLEHSRIYIFGSREEQKVFISSADFMTRNTTRRVEVAVPIKDPDIKNRILDMFATLMRDNVKARVQQPDGTYEKVETDEEPVNSQEVFFEQAYANAPELV